MNICSKSIKLITLLTTTANVAVGGGVVVVD
jgi:hypothetical protein